MNLFLIHCGFDDGDVFDGVYESHVNFFVAARDFDEARIKAKLNPVFKGRKMHIDGLQRIEAVDGHRVALEEDPTLAHGSVVTGRRNRDLAPG